MRPDLVSAVLGLLNELQRQRDTSRPYVAPPPVVDPDKELRDEVIALLRQQGVPENAIALRTAGDRLLVEAQKLDLI